MASPCLVRPAKAGSYQQRADKLIFAPGSILGLCLGALRGVFKRLRNREQARKIGVFRLSDAPRPRRVEAAAEMLDVRIEGGGRPDYPQVFHRDVVGRTPETSRTLGTRFGPSR